MSQMDPIISMDPEEQAREIQRRKGLLRDKPPLENQGGFYSRSPLGLDLPLGPMGGNGTAIPAEYSPVEWSVKKPAPRVELDVRIARAKTTAQVADRDAKRAVDAETLNPIEEDMVKSRAHALEIQSEIERVQKMLEAPTPQYQEPQMGLHQLLAAGIASMFGGAQGFNQAAQGFQEHNQALAAQRYKESLQEAENHREMVMARLRELGIDKETAQRAYEMFQKRAWDVQDQKTEADAKANDPSQIWTLYDRANTPEEKRMYGRELKRRGVPIDDATIEADAKGLEEQIAADRKGKADKLRLDKFKALKDMFPPDKQSQLGSFLLDLPDDVAANLDRYSLSELKSMAETALKGSQKVGQDLKNEWQKIANEFAAQGFQKKLDLTDAQIGLLQERTRLLPQTLAMEFGRLMVYKWAAEANAGDNAFDNQFKTWEAKNAPEIAGHKARAEALSKERSDIEATLPSLEGDAYNQATSRIAQIAEEQGRIRKRLSEIADSGPTFEGNAPMNPFQGMPNPFAQSGSAITPQGTKTTGPVAKPAKQPASTQRGSPKEPYGNTPRKNTPKTTTKPKQKAKPNQAGTIDLGGGFKIGPKH